jgi:transcriptional regulator with XRE-family HTH domain
MSCQFGFRNTTSFIEKRLDYPDRLNRINLEQRHHSRIRIASLQRCSRKTKASIVEVWEMEPGKWIRTLRKERLIKASDVERITKNIADARKNPDFYVSHSTLADIEAGSIPSIHKLFSLALALNVSLNQLLRPFGIETEVVAAPKGKSPSALLRIGATEGFATPVRAACETGFYFHGNFEVRTSPEKTTLLSFHPNELAALSPALRARADSNRYRYAMIGSKDDTMADLLPPNSLVEIDTRQKTVQAFQWHTLRDRPIYMIWHGEGHTCSWCQADSKELLLIPHPISHYLIRRFKIPGEAVVVGRVTNAWLPFGSPQFQQEAAS